ncbi:MAG: prepilin-type N-terminal cleavage/methylation domain-containing protein [Bacilli bacterium]
MDIVKNKSGFTLTEILVVVAIIAVLTGITFPISLKLLNDSTNKTLKLQTEEIVSSTRLLIEENCKNSFNTSVSCPIELTPLSVNNIVKYSGNITLDTLINNKFIDPIKIRGEQCSANIKVNGNDIGVLLTCNKYSYQTDNYK